MSDKTILVVGTYDTKNDELEYMVERVRALGGGTLSMDISVLGDPEKPTDFSKHDVAEAGGSSIKAAIDSGDENTAMQIMAKGASTLARQLFAEGKFDGVVVLGGTMGTDAALDICQALPLGVPKYVVSTVSFSPLIEPQRLSADIQMILWAGGLYGLNSVGLERRGFSEDVRKALKQAYRILFNSNLNLSQALERADEDVTAIPEVRHLLEFIRAGERGITV